MSQDFLSEIELREAQELKPSSSTEDATPDISTVRKIKLNEQNLRRAWEISSNFTREDWVAWLKKFSLEIIHESPSPAIR
jgi:FKBP12-rapamycin complex-associated protein